MTVFDTAFAFTKALGKESGIPPLLKRMGLRGYFGRKERQGLLRLLRREAGPHAAGVIGGSDG
jgi:hypothetical protein